MSLVASRDIAQWNPTPRQIERCPVAFEISAIFRPFHADILGPCLNRRTWNTISPSELHNLYPLPRSSIVQIILAVCNLKTLLFYNFTIDLMLCQHKDVHFAIAIERTSCNCGLPHTKLVTFLWQALRLSA